MPQPLLSIRSAKARDLARRMAQRSIADIVERALEAYEERTSAREPPAVFYARLKASCDPDIDLEAIVRGERRPPAGFKL
ncbi:plasmid stabilization protein (plasmid) [Bradyrhizobium sp. ISRA443]|uniref:plasmid stabilization protein n=1 Tax=unclassified Bradyrhizobium TaxID=2631580 RepID=UPI00247A3DA0|nr:MULTISPECIES: plasmid stabilization protein [unclassified Bradyrhizobium]WGR90662.1 plasmid stabilization protein [Bradyrhizobium sp. ISRA435]WGS02982.1 plasmid stabilization protein [Bradyrhizobium sp. ISRA436]WGS09981.1 plasmid stabilization protein [Bradyrhizobium sp. ISRA437]WGS16866.1 plasmid stabilization protein [Bradyrhizobium sp. ISRA443]